MKIITVNKKAKFDYEILDKWEAGIILTGQEVKSIKGGNINLKGSHVTVKDGEVFLIGAHVSPYKFAGKLDDYNPTRSRKLLLNQKEIKTLVGHTQAKGLTIVPISVYIKNNQIKVEIALVRGKKKADKRETIKKRESDKQIRRIMKDKLKK